MDPSAVSLSLVQEEQKASVMVVINPTRPGAPGMCHSAEVPPLASSSVLIGRGERLPSDIAEPSTALLPAAPDVRRDGEGGRGGGGWSFEKGANVG